MMSNISALFSSILQKNLHLNLECDDLKTKLQEMTAAANTLVRGVVDLRAENQKLRDKAAAWATLSEEHRRMHNDNRFLVESLVSDRDLLQIQLDNLLDEQMADIQQCLEDSKSLLSAVKMNKELNYELAVAKDQIGLLLKQVDKLRARQHV